VAVKFVEYIKYARVRKSSGDVSIWNVPFHVHRNILYTINFLRIFVTDLQSNIIAMWEKARYRAQTVQISFSLSPYLTKKKYRLGLFLSDFNQNLHVSADQ
jgi:hypothetical protein